MKLRPNRHRGARATAASKRPVVAPAQRPIHPEPPPRMYSLLLPPGFTGRW
jgi:hypothetical protein